MKTVTYHKLVRDRIPEIIEQSGSQCTCAVLSQEDCLLMLDKKLGEELEEYQESKSMEELADLLEVIHAVAKARGSSMEEIEVDVDDDGERFDEDDDMFEDEDEGEDEDDDLTDDENEDGN